MDALEVPIRVGAPLFSFVCCFVSVALCAFILFSRCTPDLLSFTLASVPSLPSLLIPPPCCSDGAAHRLPCLLAPTLLCALSFFFSFCYLGRTVVSLLSRRADVDAHGGTNGHTKTLAEEMSTEVHMHTHTQTQMRILTHARAHMLSDCMAFPRKNAVLGMSHCVRCVFSPPPSVVRQQSLEARTMATASAAPTMRSRSHDITTGAMFAVSFQRRRD